MSPPIDIDGSEIQEATIDGQDVSEITIDGQQAADLIDIPDSEDLQARYDFRRNDGTLPLVDQTGNGYDINNGQFSGVGASINGNQAGDFDGVDDLITTAWTNVPQPTHIFGVFEARSPLDDGFQAIWTGANGATDDNQFFIENTTDVLTTFAGVELNSNTTADTSPHVASAFYDGNNSTLRLDGVEIASGDSGTNDLGGFGIGARNDGVNFADIKAGEFLVYPQDKTSIETDVESYLADEWGISI